MGSQSFPSPEDLPDSGMEPGSPALQVDSSLSEPPGKPKEISSYSLNISFNISVFFLNQNLNNINNNSAWVHAKLLDLCPTLCDPRDCNLPGFFVHGILQTRILEVINISLSKLRISKEITKEIRKYF